MQLPASAVPRLICEEQQIHRIAVAVKVSGSLLPTELADVPPTGIDLVGKRGGPSLQFRHFPTGPGWWWWWELCFVCMFSAGGGKGSPGPTCLARVRRWSFLSQLARGSSGKQGWEEGRTSGSRMAVPVAGHRGSVLAGGHRSRKAPGT